jgi:hypothetical protein
MDEWIGGIVDRRKQPKVDGNDWRVGKELAGSESHSERHSSQLRKQGEVTKSDEPCKFDGLIVP